VIAQRNVPVTAMFVAGALLVASPAGVRAAGFDQELATVDEIKAWASKEFFGGSQTQTFSRGGKQLVVVNGQPTSGLLTSQLVIFGRSKPSERYRRVVSTGVLFTDARAKEDERGIVASAYGTISLIVPFAILDPPRLDPSLRPRPSRR
jgi:hypothetical protein